ncbi:esterase [Mycolicibacterium wolinskyi]|uniref:Esterase n=1 Tax=Mycolicibacterium wolinskyi TaxID=59750 RepID=A0A132PHU9_9MYCO|nr:alpha/beta hydrolase [Mycolicibacterium wolinskyi]KWX21582.1 esterase [Mycolicibacterium wolinskyi]
MDTVEYAPGRLADVFGEPSQPTALFWHGMQPDSRAAVRVLAEAVADLDLAVIAPDWNSRNADGGRADLINSVEFARKQADGLILIGWSLGGVAAAGLTLRAAEFDVRVLHTVCLGGAFMAPDPISGGHVLDQVPDGASPASFTLLVGDADDVVPVSAATEFAAALRARDWRVDIVEVAADHGSIAGARYDPAAERYEPADDAATHAVVRDVAARIATAVRG